jgi:hypothetical protein
MSDASRSRRVSARITQTRRDRRNASTRDSCWPSGKRDAETRAQADVGAQVAGAGAAAKRVAHRPPVELDFTAIDLAHEAQDTEIPPRLHFS